VSVVTGFNWWGHDTVSLKDQRLAELTTNLVPSTPVVTSAAPMSERQAMLYACRGDDDTPKLVYADWLDEHGEPERARLIRVTFDLANRVWQGPNLSTELPVAEWHAEIERRKGVKHGLKAELKELDTWLVKSWFPWTAVAGVSSVVRKGLVVSVTMPIGAWKIAGDLIYETELPQIVDLIVGWANEGVHNEPGVYKALANGYPLTQFRLAKATSRRIAEQIERTILNGRLPEGIITASPDSPSTQG